MASWCGEISREVRQFKGAFASAGVAVNSLMASDKEFQKIIATLKRTMDLPLTQAQRGTLKELCQEIVGDRMSRAPPSFFPVKEEADAKRAALARAEAAEQRVKELEDRLEEALARRSWWRR